MSEDDGLCFEKKGKPVMRMGDGYFPKVKRAFFSKVFLSQLVCEACGQLIPPAMDIAGPSSKD